VISIPAALRLSKFRIKYKSYADVLHNENQNEQFLLLNNDSINQNEQNIPTQTQQQNKLPKNDNNTDLVMLVQALNSQVQLLTTLLTDIYKATIFRPIEQVRKQNIINIIKALKFIEIQ